MEELRLCKEQAVDIAYQMHIQAFKKKYTWLQKTGLNDFDALLDQIHNEVEKIKSPAGVSAYLDRLGDLGYIALADIVLASIDKESSKYEMPHMHYHGEENMPPSAEKTVYRVSRSL